MAIKLLHAFSVKVYILCIVICYVYAEGTSYVSLTWYGGSSTCTYCSVGSYVLNFACNDGRGDFNDGKASFLDPIPPGVGNVLYNVTGTLQGWFGCKASSQVLGLMFLNGMHLFPFSQEYRHIFQL
jgi:hypothetical protein